MNHYIFNIFAISIFLSLFACEGWDKTWHLDRRWSSEITVLNNKKSKGEIDRIAILGIKKKHIYTTLSEFMKQKPFFINDRDKIISLIDAISLSPETKVDNPNCLVNESKDKKFHIIAFDSSTMRAAYIILSPCSDKIHCEVWNYDDSAIYWIKTPYAILTLMN